MCVLYFMLMGGSMLLWNGIISNDDISRFSNSFNQSMSLGGMNALLAFGTSLAYMFQPLYLLCLINGILLLIPIKNNKIFDVIKWGTMSGSVMIIFSYATYLFALKAFPMPIIGVYFCMVLILCNVGVFVSKSKEVKTDMRVEF